MSFNVAPQEVGEVRRMSRSTRNDSVAGVPGISFDGSEQQWKPSPRLYLAFLTLSVITMMVALDGTSLSVALPVDRLKSHVFHVHLLTWFCADYIRQAGRDRNRSLLVRNFFSPVLDDLPAELRQLLSYLWEKTDDHDRTDLLHRRRNRRRNFP